MLGVPILFDEIGSWWPSKGGGTDTGDIDVVARHEKSRTTYVADVKYTHNKYGFTEFNVLHTRIKNLPYGGQIIIFVFSKNGFLSDFSAYAREKKITLVDLEQLSTLFGKA